jgi:hypothetical protein
MNAVHAEVAVESENRRAWLLFHHANETRVGERHRDVGVARHQLAEHFRLRGDAIHDLDHASNQELEDRGRTSGEPAEEKACLRENGFARQERRLEVGPLFGGPTMESIAPIEQRHERTGVEQNGPRQRPKVFR